jgi:hypothetical protein
MLVLFKRDGLLTAFRTTWCVDTDGRLKGTQNSFATSIPLGARLRVDRNVGPWGFYHAQIFRTKEKRGLPPLNAADHARPKLLTKSKLKRWITLSKQSAP